MRIALIADWFAEKMGYAENALPKALAAAGHEVHLITSDVQPYFDTPEYEAAYEPFIGPPIVPTGIKEFDGYTLHRLPHGFFRGRLRISGLRDALRRLRPDVVQTFEVANWSTAEAALEQPRTGYRLFLESHIHASVFPVDHLQSSTPRRWRWRLVRGAMGRLISWRSERCYPISPDALDIARDWFGIAPEKLQVCSLGVDTDAFHPLVDDVDRAERAELRGALGFGPDEVVCIYTGRFTDGKGPAILAEAVAELTDRGVPVRGLFVGSGSAAQVEALDHPGCVLHPFVPAADLPPLYRAADIGVWPRQESTSQLDAAASGLPIIVSDRVTVNERVDGNGLRYAEGDARDLALQIEHLLDPVTRDRLGSEGATKMVEHFSWRRIASERAADYRAALGDR